MAQSHYRFEDIATITKETLQVIGRLIPATVTEPGPLLHQFPRYVFEELHNLAALIARDHSCEFKEVINQMAALQRVCAALDPSLSADAVDGEMSPVVIEPSHLDLIRSLVSNLEFTLLGTILSQEQPSSPAKPSAP